MCEREHGQSWMQERSWGSFSSLSCSDLVSLSVRDRPHISELEVCRLIKQKLTPSVYQLQPRRSGKLRINKMSSIRLDYFICHMIALPICAWKEILAIFQPERARDWRLRGAAAASDRAKSPRHDDLRTVSNSSSSPCELAEVQSQGWRSERQEKAHFK